MMDTVLGLPVGMTVCSLSSTTLGQLSEPCNTQQYVSPPAVSVYTCDANLAQLKQGTLLCRSKRCTSRSKALCFGTCEGLLRQEVL